MDVLALVIFTDIRGFTNWAKDNEVFANLDRFLSDFLALIHKHFSKDQHFVKALGDGALILRELALTSKATPQRLIAEVLKTVKKVDDEFRDLCESFGRSIGHTTDLKLGWGIVRGKCKKVNGDYAGSNVNKCARLCDLARPFGVVIDRADFEDKPESKHYKFYPQTRKVGDVGEVRVWVTKEIESGFLTRENRRHVPEVHVAGACIQAAGRKTFRVLLARRNPGRRLYPNKIEGCGGQLALSETFWDGVRRHFHLEMGIEVRVLEDLHCFYVIREPNEPLIPGIRFLCEQVDDKEPRSENHSEVWWASDSDFRKIAAEDFVGNLKEEVLELLERYKESRT